MNKKMRGEIRRILFHYHDNDLKFKYIFLHCHQAQFTEMHSTNSLSTY